jgi:hypothetical protein
MRSDLTNVTKSLRANVRLQLSASEARWLTEEVDKLLASGYEEAAAALRHKSAHFRKDSGSPPLTSRFVKKATREPSAAAKDGKVDRSRSPLCSRRHQKLRHRLVTAAGSLIIEKEQFGSESTQTATADHASVLLRIAFFPKFPLSSTALTAQFLKRRMNNMEPKIERLIQVYNIISEYSIAVLYAQSNDVVGWRKLFALGEASPFDRDENSVNLLCVSLRCHPGVTCLVGYLLFSN